MSFSSSEFNPINTTRGWLIFVSCILVASFVGGAVRVFFSQDQVEQWVRSAVYKSQIPYDVRFRKGELILAEGGWPDLALRLNQVSIQALEACNDDSLYEVDTVDVPVRIFELLTEGRLTFGQVSFAGAKVVMDALPCNSASQNSVKNKAPSVVESKQGIEEVIGSPLLPRPGVKHADLLRKTVERIFAFLSNDGERALHQLNHWVAALFIKEISIEREVPGEGRFRVVTLQDSHLQWDAENASLELNTELMIEPEVVLKQSLSPLRLDIKVDERQLSGVGEMNLQEGEISAGFNIRRGQNEELKLSAQLSMQHFPADRLFEMVYRAGWNSSLIHPELTWLTCTAELNAVISQLPDTPLLIQDCQLLGDIGRIETSPIAFDLWRQQLLQPFELKIQRLNLKEFIHSVDRKGPSGIMSRYGWLQGTLKVESAHQAQFVGELREAEFNFSRGGIRAVQAVDSISTEFSLADERVSGRIQKMELQGGEFSGVVSFNFDREFRQGLLQVDIDRLAFSPSVQRLMVRGQMRPMEIYGKGRVNAFALTDWKGTLGTKGFKGQLFDAADVKIKTELSDGMLTVTAQLLDLQLPKTSWLTSYLEPLLLDQVDISHNAFKASEGWLRLSLQPGSVHWDRVRLLSPQNKVSLASRGIYRSESGMDGWIDVDLHNKKLLRWDVAGQPSHLMLYPSIKMLQRLAREENSKVEPITADMTPADRLKMLHKIVYPNSITDVNSFAEKMMEAARQLLSFGTEEPLVEDVSRKKTESDIPTSQMAK